MPNTLLISGSYTPYARLSIGASGRKISLTGFSATFRKNKVISNGAWRFAESVNSVAQHRGAYFQDVPSIDLSITFEIEADFLEDIFDILRTERNRAFEVSFYDQDSDISWQFEECFLSSFSFSVGTNTILSVSMSFFVRVDGISYSWGLRELHAINQTDLPLTDPVAYYEWNIRNTRGEIPDITEFSFNFTQQLTPKYGCLGVQSDTAPISTHILFGLPEMSCTITQLMHKSDSIDFSGDKEGTHMNRRTSFDSDSISFGIRERDIFTLTGVSVKEVTPSFDGSYHTYTTNYDIHGILRK